jgi:hypothetical protein
MDAVFGAMEQEYMATMFERDLGMFERYKAASHKIANVVIMLRWKGVDDSNFGKVITSTELFKNQSVSAFHKSIRFKQIWLPDNTMCKYVLTEKKNKVLMELNLVTEKLEILQIQKELLLKNLNKHCEEIGLPHSQVCTISANNHPLHSAFYVASGGISLSTMLRSIAKCDQDINATCVQMGDKKKAKSDLDSVYYLDVSDFYKGLSSLVDQYMELKEQRSHMRELCAMHMVGMASPQVCGVIGDQTQGQKEFAPENPPGPPAPPVLEEGAGMPC